jgi:hypothetical protein
VQPAAPEPRTPAASYSTYFFSVIVFLFSCYFLIFVSNYVYEYFKQDRTWPQLAPSSSSSGAARSSWATYATGSFRCLLFVVVFSNIIILENYAAPGPSLRPRPPAQVQPASPGPRTPPAASSIYFLLFI